MEHPQIARSLQTGYPTGIEKPKHFGIDYFGHEIMEGDSIIVDPERGEIILEDNLEDYLIEVRGFEFKKA